jgi:hypothetical protein
MRNALLGLLVLGILSPWAGAATRVAVLGEDGEAFPVPLEEYAADERGATLMEILTHRIEVEPFNIAATLIFALAIIHTFMAPRILRLSHHYKHQHEAWLEQHLKTHPLRAGQNRPVSFRAEVLHFLGEIEVVFGLWVLPLLVAITAFQSWHTAEEYLSHGINYTEPLFVVVIMAIAASRPVLRLAEVNLERVARLGGGTPGAWWLAILTVGPILGSFITEPAAMTISALLLLQNFYRFQPSQGLRYATLGLLFVNVSVGGTLTHFAAPPVLMVAGTWGWGFSHMLIHFGWKAIIGILFANTLYYFVFRAEFRRLGLVMRPESASGLPTEFEVEEAHGSRRHEVIPKWVTLAHVFALFWTVFTAHYTALYVGGFLVFLAFTQATRQHQDPVNLRSPVLVGFFLAGLVIHGTLQQWWIEPVLRSLTALPLMIGSTVLTAFNDNAAITYLASLVPGFSDEMKYAVVAGAVTGGGLTVIANAPNPAGQSILGASFGENGISPLKLFLGAVVPTLLMFLAFLLLPS